METINITVFYVIEKKGIVNDRQKTGKNFKVPKDSLTLSQFKNSIKNEVENCKYKCITEKIHKDEPYLLELDDEDIITDVVPTQVENDIHFVDFLRVIIQEPNTADFTMGFPQFKPEDFIYAFDRLNIYFIHDTEFNSTLQLFPYEKQEPIKYPLVCSRDECLDEATATPFLIRELAQVLKHELETCEYKIESVNTEIPFDLYKFKGLTSAVIAPKSIEDQNLAENVCIGFEFKKPTSKADTHLQLILEFFFAASKRTNKNLPILFVSTDFYTFKFFTLQSEKIIRFYQTRNFDYAIKIIKQFILHHYSLASKISLSSDQIEKIIGYFKNGDISYFKTQEGRDLFKLIECHLHSNVDQPIDYFDEQIESRMEKRNKIEKFYQSLSPKELKERKFSSCRTYFVYKIEIDNKPYVLKFADMTDQIGRELSNEVAIYRYLSYLRKIGDCFPQLYFAGNFGTCYFAIVTPYIEGRKPSWDIESDRLLCGQTLKKINRAGVVHNDARPSNFVMDKKKQLINQNGKLVGVEETAIILDFGFSEKHFRKYNEDLRPE